MNKRQEEIQRQKHFKYECADYGLPFSAYLAHGIGFPKWNHHKSVMRSIYGQKTKEHFSRSGIPI